MSIAAFVGSIVTALFFTLLFWFVLHIRGPWGSFWLFFLIVLFGVLTVGVWIEPIGPMYRDVAWGPLIAAGIIFSLILAAATPRADQPDNQAVPPRERKNYRRQERSMAVLNVFFWVLLIVFGAGIIVGLAT